MKNLLINLGAVLCAWLLSIYLPVELPGFLLLPDSVVRGRATLITWVLAGATFGLAYLIHHLKRKEQGR